MNARSVLWAGTLGLVAVAAFVGARHLKSQALTTRAAYTLYMYEKASWADATKGSRKVRYFFEAVASDGTRAIGNYLPQPDGRVRFLARNIARPSDRSRVVTHEGAGVKTTWYLSALKAAALGAPPTDPTCRTPWPGFRLVGEEEAYGFKSVKWVYRSSDSTYYVWVAPELDCAKLAGRLEGGHGDSTLSTITIQRPLAVVRGEPDRSFFDLSKDYAEARPSEFYARSLDAEQPGAGPACGDVTSKLQKQDEQYARSQADKP